MAFPLEEGWRERNEKAAKKILTESKEVGKLRFRLGAAPGAESEKPGVKKTS